MDVNPSTNAGYSGAPIAAPRKLNWAAIVGGAFTTLAISVLMLYLGSALGLSIFSARDMTQGDLALSWAAIGWLALTVIVSSFLGAWFAGRWSNVWLRDDASAHGLLTWALSTVILTIAAGGLLQLSAAAMPSRDLTSPGGAEGGTSPSAMVTPGSQSPAMYSNLDDQQFTGFVLNRAKDWESSHGIKGGAEEPINVSAGQKQNNTSAQNADKNQQSQNGKPSIKNKDELVSFVALNTKMNSDQARQFVDDNSKEISQAQAQSQQRWSQAHAADLARADSMRKGASAIAWTMFGLMALALAASLAGARSGWEPAGERDRTVDTGTAGTTTADRTL